jgi:prepilin-type N-terminal cleavage/methylation domain-containing protein
MGKSNHRPRRAAAGLRDGFTLVELLVVIFIILLVSAVALPTVIPAITHRQVSEAARLLQGAIVGARDAAIHANAPRGIRLLPDPTFTPLIPQGQTGAGQIDPTRILACNRIVPIQPAPDYSEGFVNILRDPNFPGAISPFPSNLPPFPQQTNPQQFILPYPYPSLAVATAGTYVNRASVLMVEQSPYTFSTDSSGNVTTTVNPPTSWFWNLRVGDKIRFGNSGRLYTIIGPMSIGPADGNSELFVNDGLPGANQPLLQRQYYFNNVPAPLVYPEYLFLVNGLDDNNDGVIDSGWDGIDNNFDGLIDEMVPSDPSIYYTEWEIELWDDVLSRPPPLTNPQIYNVQSNTPVPTGFLNLSYTVIRRPIAAPNQREVALPSNVVIDLTTWGALSAKQPASLERSRLPVNGFTGHVDILVSPQGDVIPSTIYATPAIFGMANSFYHFWLAERGDLFDPDTTATHPPYLPLPVGLNPNALAGREVKGENRLVTLFTRSGQLTTNEILNFDTQNIQNTAPPYYNTNIPFLEAQQGARGGQ